MKDDQAFFVLYLRCGGGEFRLRGFGLGRSVFGSLMCETALVAKGEPRFLRLPFLPFLRRWAGKNGMLVPKPSPDYPHSYPHYPPKIQDLCMDSWGDTRFSVDKLREERGRCGGRSDRGGLQGDEEKLLGDREAPGDTTETSGDTQRHPEVPGDTTEASGDTQRHPETPQKRNGII